MDKICSFAPREDLRRCDSVIADRFSTLADQTQSQSMVVKMLAVSLEEMVIRLQQRFSEREE